MNHSVSTEQVRWLMKVVQPERTVASLPGGSEFGPSAHADLLGLPRDVYTTQLAGMQHEASHAADELLADPAVASLVDRLPLWPGAKVAVIGDSLTSDPQSWAVILTEVLAKRRGGERISLTVDAVAGESTTGGLVRIADVIAHRPDWVFFLLGTNDARTQGPDPTKTLVHHEETRRNVAELRRRIANETTATSVWITPPAVDVNLAADHWGLARFGVRFRHEDLERVATIIRGSDGPVIDAFAALGAPPSRELLMADGVHLTVAGHRRLAREVLRGWSDLRTGR